MSLRAAGEDLPPRCWGVGLVRTGSTSFCEALTRLGYAPVAQSPRFEQLRTLRGGCENGVVLHYKYLDYVFPGSKFVLMTRPVQAWLASMLHAHNSAPRPIEGHHERIARRMAIHETVGYDEAVLTASFHRHHAEIRRYFWGRPNDLLEMDITAGDGWDKLCPFLGPPVPEAAFPRLNVGVGPS
ncbi:MAG: sulfotransferase family protein [Pseudomonadota bacterium]